MADTDNGGGTISGGTSGSTFTRTQANRPLPGRDTITTPISGEGITRARVGSEITSPRIGEGITRARVGATRLLDNQLTTVSGGPLVRAGFTAKEMSLAQIGVIIGAAFLGLVLIRRL